MDPVALASLIVGIASLAWAIYADQRKRADTPSTTVVIIVVTEAPAPNRSSAIGRVRSKLRRILRSAATETSTKMPPRIPPLP